MIKRQNGHGGIERTKNGNYRIRVYDIVDGNRKRITWKNNIKSKKEAERMLEEYFADQDGKDSKAKRTKTRGKHF